MTGILADILTSPLLQGIIATLATVLGVVLFGKHQKKKGAEDARTQDKEADHERAAQIRDRIERARNNGGVHEFDDSGYRD